jgi:hypothetical protein
MKRYLGSKKQKGKRKNENKSFSLWMVQRFGRRRIWDMAGVYSERRYATNAID